MLIIFIVERRCIEGPEIVRSKNIIIIPSICFSGSIMIIIMVPIPIIPIGIPSSWWAMVSMMFLPYRCLWPSSHVGPMGSHLSI
ncbi:hypothetical protein FKM82_001322 [Ascaphus truei]